MCLHDYQSPTVPMSPRIIMKVLDNVGTITPMTDVETIIYSWNYQYDENTGEEKRTGLIEYTKSVIQQRF